MNTAFPGGFPQISSLVPLAKRLLLTVSADQLVWPRLVEYCGCKFQALVPVEYNKRLVLTVRPTIVGGGGGGTVTMVLPKK